jgi:hypothetical protein
MSIIVYLVEWEGVEILLAPATRWPPGYNACFVISRRLQHLKFVFIPQEVTASFLVRLDRNRLVRLLTQQEETSVSSVLVRDFDISPTDSLQTYTGSYHVRI